MTTSAQPIIPKVLVVYGMPPKIALNDAPGPGGRPIGATFIMTKSNRASFEKALRRALASFMRSDAVIMSARFVYVETAADVAAAIKTADYTQVIYYGHGQEGAAVLLPTRKTTIIALQLARAIKGTKVTHFDILGCQSMAIAAELSGMVPGLRVGNLRARRFDNINYNPRTQEVIDLAIEHQPIYHFGGQ
jgi:hypothetical protein